MCVLCKYEFVLILLQVCFYGIYAVPSDVSLPFFFVCAGSEMQITFRTTLLEATLTCHGNTRENHWLLLNLKTLEKFSLSASRSFLWAARDYHQLKISDVIAEKPKLVCKAKVCECEKQRHNESEKIRKMLLRCLRSLHKLSMWQTQKHFSFYRLRISEESHH